MTPANKIREMKEGRKEGRKGKAVAGGVGIRKEESL